MTLKNGVGKCSLFVLSATDAGMKISKHGRAFVTFVSVCLLFLLCSRVSILRSYEIALSITWMVELNRGEAEENFLS